MVANVEIEKAWQERVAQWRASGLTQRAFALEHGFSQKQISYWSRRLATAEPASGFVPVRVTPAVAADAISLRSAHGWTLTLPRDVPASWLAEMMRAL
jgi:hypothetical protein